MKTIEIRNVSLEPLRNVSERLRAQDEVEVYLMTGKPPVEALETAVAVSDEVYIGYIDGSPEAVFGVTGLVNGVGIPWMLGTDSLSKASRHWLPMATHWVERLHVRYPTLTNIVHKKNASAIRWLKRLGFEFIDAEVPHYPSFIQFVRCADVRTNHATGD